MPTHSVVPSSADAFLNRWLLAQEIRANPAQNYLSRAVSKLP